MAKSPTGTTAEGENIIKNVNLGENSKMTQNEEESKLDPQLMSGHSTFKAERGLIHASLPPSATHTKNT